MPVTEQQGWFDSWAVTCEQGELRPIGTTCSARVPGRAFLGFALCCVMPVSVSSASPAVVQRLLLRQPRSPPWSPRRAPALEELQASLRSSGVPSPSSLCPSVSPARYCLQVRGTTSGSCSAKRSALQVSASFRAPGHPVGTGSGCPAPLSSLPRTPTHSDGTPEVSHLLRDQGKKIKIKK